MNRKYFILILIFSVLLCYVNTLRNGFIWDDDKYITSNEEIKSLSNIPYMFKVSKEEPYRPLRTLTFALEYSLFGLKPSPYHFDNVLIHILNVLLLFNILLLIFRDEKLAFFSALIFGIYPAWNEAIVWVKNRATLLSMFFMLLSFYLYLKNKILLSFVPFILALLSKEIAIVLPAVITAYEFIFKEKRNKTILSLYWIFGVLWVVFLFSLYHGKIGIYTPGEGLFFSLKIIFNFLLILFFPFRLNAEREINFPSTVFDWQVIISFIMMIVFVWWLYKDRFRHKIISFIILWGLISIIPTANPGVVAGRPLAEHRLYLVGPAFSIFIYLLLKNKKVILYGFLPVFFATSFMRNFDWKDSYIFWSKTVKYSSSPRAYTNLALAEKSRGNIKKAKEYFREAIKKDPDYLIAVRGLADILVDEGKMDDAETLLKDAIKRHPEDINLYSGLIDLYLKQDRTYEAREFTKKAAKLIDLNVGELNDYMLVAIESFQLKLFDYALNIFKRIYEKRPYSVFVINNIASVYHAKKDYANAEKYYKLAIEKDPKNPFFYYNLANLYYDINEKDKAILNYEKAIELDNTYSNAWYNLGVVYREKGESKKAEECFAKVREIEGENLKENYM